MDEQAKGRVVTEDRLRVEPVKLKELADAIGTESSAETARLVPWFGPTIAGDQRLVSVLGLDLERAMLAGQSYEWTRPFVEGEDIDVRVFVEDVYAKGANFFGIVTAEFSAADGTVVQRQRTTFLERGSQQ